MTQRTIQKYLKQLRAECIDGTDDVVLKGIAYEMETAIRRVTEKTVGWPSLSQQAKDGAVMLRQKLKS